MKNAKIMVYRKGGFLSRFEKWYLDGKEVEVVNAYKYLGFTLTTKLSKDMTLSKYVGKAKKKIFQLLKVFYVLGHQEFEVFIKLLEAVIYPQVLFASELWGPFFFKTIEGVHIMAAMKFWGVKIRMPNNLVYGELGRHPFYIESQLRAVNY